MYYWPKLEKYKFSRQEVHRVNLFGDKTDIKERLMYIFQINQSVFEDNSYGYCLETLISEIKNAYTKDIHIYQEPIKRIFENDLYINNQLFDDSMTNHHIIFKNSHNNGHPSHQDNLVQSGSFCQRYPYLISWTYGSEKALPTSTIYKTHETRERSCKKRFLEWLQKLEKVFDNK